MDMAMAFILRLQSSACRYRVRYTREVESEGDMRGRKGELQIDKVEGQKDFPKKNLENAGAVGCVCGGGLVFESATHAGLRQYSGKMGK